MVPSTLAATAARACLHQPLSPGRYLIETTRRSGFPPRRTTTESGIGARKIPSAIGACPVISTLYRPGGISNANRPSFEATTTADSPDPRKRIRAPDIGFGAPGPGPPTVTIIPRTCVALGKGSLDTVGSKLHPDSTPAKTTASRTLRHIPLRRPKARKGSTSLAMLLTAGPGSAPASIANRVRRRAIREATRTRHVRRSAESYVLLEERPSHPGFSRLRILRTLVRRVVDRAPIHVDCDLSKKAGASHAKILARGERCRRSPAPTSPRPHAPNYRHASEGFHQPRAALSLIDVDAAAARSECELVAATRPDLAPGGQCGDDGASDQGR